MEMLFYDAVLEYKRIYCDGDHHTPRAKRNHLNRFCGFINESLGSSCKLSEITSKTIREYQDSLFEFGEASATIEVRMCLVRGFFRFIQQTKPGFPNPCQGLRRVIVKKIKAQGLTAEDVAKMLRALNELPEDFRGLRLRCWFELGLFAGARLGDLRTVTAGQFKVEQNLLQNVLRKNSVEADLPIREKAIPLFLKYLQQREEILKKTIDGYEDFTPEFKNRMPLFPTLYRPLRKRKNPKDYRLTDKAIYYAISLHGERCGVKVHPHALRHTFSHKYLEINPNLRDLASVLGHAKADSAMIYSQPEVAKHFPIINNSKFEY